MKVAFVTPASPRLKMATSSPPINLGILAAVAREAGHEARIFDGVIGQDYKRDLIAWSPDVACITATTPQAPLAYSLCERLKDAVPTIMGGIHPTVMPEEAAQHADAVVVGEGEAAMLELLGMVARKERPPRITEGKPVMDLDTIPAPAWDLIEVEKYMHAYDNASNAFPYGMGAGVIRLGNVLTSRGCAGGRCAFCWNSHRTAPVRWNSAGRVVDDLKFLIDRYKINAAFFVDDEFVAHKPRLEKIAALLKEGGISPDFALGCQARSTSLDVGTCRLMKSMGFRFASVGFESGNGRVLSMLKCGITSIADNERALKNASEAGLMIGGSFIFGTPTETKAEMLDTLRFIEKHDEMVFIGINVLIPYPGTAIWSMAKSMNLLPGAVDYEKLIPTSKAADTYITCSTMGADSFQSFIMDLQRITFTRSKMNLIAKSEPTVGGRLRSYAGLYRHKLFWYMLARHPMRSLGYLSWHIVRGAQA